MARLSAGGPPSRRRGAGLPRPQASRLRRAAWGGMPRVVGAGASAAAFVDLAAAAAAEEPIPDVRAPDGQRGRRPRGHGRPGRRARGVRSGPDDGRDVGRTLRRAQVARGLRPWERGGPVADRPVRACPRPRRARADRCAPRRGGGRRDAGGGRPADAQCRAAHAPRQSARLTATSRARARAPRRRRAPCGGVRSGRRSRPPPTGRTLQGAGARARLRARRRRPPRPHHGPAGRRAR